ncbi:MAG: hypothetical protein ACI9H6_000047 [Patiriisocius sp.]|jgi:hypothetical protein
MKPFEIRISEDIANAVPEESGHFGRIIKEPKKSGSINLEEMDIDDIFDLWTYQRCSIVGGVQMPCTPEDTAEKLPTESLLMKLRNCNVDIVFVTLDAYKQLMHLMMAPTVSYVDKRPPKRISARDANLSGLLGS